MEEEPDDYLVFALEEPYRNFWTALGKFVHQFATVEREAQALLRHLSAVSDATGAAVFSGVKVDAAMGLVKRLCDAKDLADVKLRLKPAFDQLGAINTVRNNILHWGASRDHAGDQDEYVVSNRYWAPSTERLRTYRVTPHDLANMTGDLYHIGLHLNREMLTEEEIALSPILTEVFAQIESGSWLYKPPQQSPPKTKT